MKKILLVAAIASTFMAFAEEGTSNATEVQQIGITAITTSRQSVIVAFSYTGVTADKLVKTTNLTVGDELIAYGADGNYKSWILTAEDATGKLYWAPYSNHDGTPGSVASGTDQAVGTGIWLKRADPPASAYSFYIYGTPATEKEITVTKGTTMLIGNPNSGEKAPTIANAAVGDAIYIPNDKAFNKYTYGSNGTWNKGFASLGEGVTPTFDANTGAWYESKGTEKDVTITW